MPLFADVMFGPVHYILAYLPQIMLALVLLVLVMTAVLVGLLIYLKKRK